MKVARFILEALNGPLRWRFARDTALIRNGANRNYFWVRRGKPNTVAAVVSRGTEDRGSLPVPADDPRVLESQFQVRRDGASP